MSTAWKSPVCTCTSARAPIWSIFARSAGRWSGPPAKSAARSRRSAPAAACRFPIGPSRPTSTSTPTFSFGTKSRRGLEERFGHKVRWKSSRAATSSPRRLPRHRDPRDQADGRQHVLSARRRLQQSGPADPVRLLSPDVDRSRRHLFALPIDQHRGNSVSPLPTHKFDVSLSLDGRGPG